MNWRAAWTIFIFEVYRMKRTLGQSVASPVISTSLYFVVFGSAIGSQIKQVGGVSYGAFIVPGLMMMSILTLSLTNASFGIFFPKFTGSIYEIFAAPISYVEILIGYVGAAVAKAVFVGLLILLTAHFFVDIQIQHPVIMILFLFLTSLTFSLFGFIIGVWADNFEKLQVFPLLVVTPLAFLGGSFYSIKMLPPLWQKISMINPVVYLISGFRWSFYGQSDIDLKYCFIIIFLFLILSLLVIRKIFITGYKLKS